ncbi:MAG TPA: peptide chain release factor N(5)-glutamine methyltransferase [Candidatus Pseudogracilibacillus intestinigallinarum]|uniref:peptide chain release factor N(5)-glutamine methyltransferase n=1 Tax=Candidatus Pseudogracilibacillus intestinigallinarum TaxID=2838742 RepID=A0A9D1PN54_9BACI|nr:peptide chain release factor N(5)-glutamine methyltransferase [Candidatus Pseudogracilibacillus intestinigallinarum]
MNTRKVYEVLTWASSFLEKHGRDPHIAKILIEHHVQVDSDTFHMILRDEMEEKQYRAFMSDVKEHVDTGIPVQHLVGYEYFYGRRFTVNEHVLIPRFETEELVYHLIQLIESKYKDETVTIVDIGTGSGVIATTLALELSNAVVYATDISEAALQVATQNATNLGANVTFRQGSFLEPVVEANINPQIIVSNPPYIDKAEIEELEDTVKNYDPHVALFAPNKGLYAYESIMEQSKKIPSIECICMEIGYEQAKAITNIVEKTYPTAQTETIVDINGKDRIISATLR